MVARKGDIILHNVTGLVDSFLFALVFCLFENPSDVFCVRNHLCVVSEGVKYARNKDTLWFTYEGRKQRVEVFFKDELSELVEIAVYDEEYISSLYRTTVHWIEREGL